MLTTTDDVDEIIEKKTDDLITDSVQTTEPIEFSSTYSQPPVSTMTSDFPTTILTTTTTTTTPTTTTTTTMKTTTQGITINS